jgi:hypothetical protein
MKNQVTEHAEETQSITEGIISIFRGEDAPETGA